LKINVAKWAKALCYPRCSEEELKARLRELEELGVEELLEEGRSSIDGLKVLGKGCVGVVVVAVARGAKLALKARRTDADRESLLREAEMLKVANSLGIGPRLIGATRNFLATELIEGEVIEEWFQCNPDASELIRVMRELLWQCFKLDQAGLDHGELSRAGRHILVSKSGAPVIVDFESASLHRKPRNVTSLCQYFLIRGRAAERVVEALGLSDEDKRRVLRLLRDYKRGASEASLKALLRGLKLT